MHQALGASVWQESWQGSCPGLLAPPLLPLPAAASPPPSACRIHPLPLGCLRLCYLKAARGWSRADSPRPSRPPPPCVILSQQPPPTPSSLRPLCSSSQHPLGLALSAVVFSPASPYLLSLPRALRGGGGRGHLPRPSFLHPQHSSGSASCPKLEPDPVPAAWDPSSPSESPRLGASWTGAPGSEPRLGAPHPVTSSHCLL